MPDLINGLFEILGGFFIGLSCLRIYRDKSVKGISYTHVAYFTLWGFWNLYYYPGLGQWWSFWGGVGVVVMNTIWLGMLIYYGKSLSVLPSRYVHQAASQEVVQTENPQSQPQGHSPIQGH